MSLLPPSPRRLLRALLVAFGGLAIVMLPILSPPLREALVALEPVVAPTLFALAVVWWALGWRGGARGRLRAELRLGRWLGAWGWALAILLFELPCWAHWSMRPPGGVAAFAALFGHIPWSDVHAHYEGARRLLADGAFGPFSERRPLNAALLSVRLAMLGDLRAAILLQAAVTGLGAWLLARAVALRHGLGPSLAVFAFVLGLVRDFLPTAATEPLGIGLACLAYAILLTRGTRVKLGWMVLGLLALDTALRARPGAQFLVPAVMVWALWIFRARWRQAVPAVAAVAVAGSLATTAVNAFYGSGQATFTTYPAYTFYGLTRYSNWTQARLDFGSELDRLGPEKQVARFLYARAFDNVRRDPRPFLRALMRNLTRFSGKLPANLARAVTLRPLVSAQSGPPSVEQVTMDTRLATPLLLLGAAGFLLYLWRAPGPDRGFWLAVTAGLLGSVPFVYGDAGFRGLAPAYPLVAAALGLGLSRRERPPAALARQRRLVFLSGGLAAGLLLLALAGPALARLAVRRPDPRLLHTVEPGAVVVAPAASARVVVTNVRRAPFESTPRIERREFARMLEWASLEPEQQAHLERTRTPFAMLSAYDHAARRLALLVAPVEMLQEAEAFLSVEVRPVPGSQFFDVVSWRRLDEPPGQRHGPLAPEAAEPAAEKED